MSIMSEQHMGVEFYEFFKGLMKARGIYAGRLANMLGRSPNHFDRPEWKHGPRLDVARDWIAAIHRIEPLSATERVALMRLLGVGPERGSA